MRLFLVQIRLKETQRGFDKQTARIALSLGLSLSSSEFFDYRPTNPHTPHSLWKLAQMADENKDRRVHSELKTKY